MTCQRLPTPKHNTKTKLTKISQEGGGLGLDRGAVAGLDRGAEAETMEDQVAMVEPKEIESTKV